MADDDDRPLVALLRLQDLDTTIAQVEHRKASLPEREQLAQADRRLREMAARLTEARARRQVLADSQLELDRQVQELTERRKKIEARLYAARNSAPRDLQAMHDEVEHIDQRRTEIEDVELSIMEEQEPIDAEVDYLETERATVVEAVEAFRAAIAAAESVIAIELKGLHDKRTLAAGKVPRPLLDRYDKIRARLKGVGAARLIGSHCDGCHLELPSVEVERIRHLPADEVVTCDQCGRILVVGAPPPVAADAG